MICLQKSVCTRYDVEHISRKLLSLTRKLQERKALETIKVAIFAADAIGYLKFGMRPLPLCEGEIKYYVFKHYFNRLN